jgi:soluble lytic murein transglycosylase-like protein
MACDPPAGTLVRIRLTPPNEAARAVGRAAVALGLAALCAGCAAGGGAYYGAGWDGRRGYDGNGDYGYDLAASRSEASSYRARAARDYPVPGTPDDPWGPYIREAAARFQIPERWIRAVMRQESGGRAYGADGTPITSSAGAMGLMQVMPRTYDTLRQQYALGPDPYDPHDNILAGAAYIRDMYAIYGAPAFLAAYNAGPDRLASYLAGGTPLPDETVNYLASVAPRLGTEVAMTGPLAVYAGVAAPASGQAYASGGDAAPPADPADRAFDGGGLVTPEAPTGLLTGTGQGIALVAPAALLTPAPAPAPAPAPPPAVARGGDWGIQVGAFPDPAHSQAVIAAARARAADLLAGAQPAITPVQHAGILYRARLVGLSGATAESACSRLAGAGMDCFAVPPGF